MTLVNIVSYSVFIHLISLQCSRTELFSNLILSAVVLSKKQKQRFKLNDKKNSSSSSSYLNIKNILEASLVVIFGIWSVAISQMPQIYNSYMYSYKQAFSRIYIKLTMWLPILQSKYNISNNIANPVYQHKIIFLSEFGWSSIFCF